MAKERYWLAGSSLFGCAFALSLPTPLQAATGLIAAYSVLDRLNVIEVSLIPDRVEREQTICKLLEEQITACKDLTSDFTKPSFFVGLPLIRYADEGILGFLWTKTFGAKRWNWQSDFYLETRYVDKKYGTNGFAAAEGFYESPSRFRFTIIEVQQIAPAPKRVVIRPKEVVEV